MTTREIVQRIWADVYAETFAASLTPNIAERSAPDFEKARRRAWLCATNAVEGMSFADRPGEKDLPTLSE